MQRLILIIVLFVICMSAKANNLLSIMKGGAHVCIFDVENNSVKRLNNVPFFSNYKETLLSLGADQNSFWCTFPDGKQLIINHYDIVSLKLLQQFKIPHISKYSVYMNDTTVFFSKSLELVFFAKTNEKKLIKYNLTNNTHSIVYEFSSDVIASSIYKLGDETILVKSLYAYDHRNTRGGKTKIILLNINSLNVNDLELGDHSFPDILAVSPNKKYILTGEESLLKLLDITDATQPKVTILFSNGNTYRGDFSKNSSQIIFSVNAKEIYLYELSQDKTQLKRLSVKGTSIYSPRFYNDIIIAYANWTPASVSFYDLNQNKVIFTKCFSSIFGSLLVCNKYLLFDE